MLLYLSPDLVKGPPKEGSKTEADFMGGPKSNNIPAPKSNVMSGPKAGNIPAPKNVMGGPSGEMKPMTPPSAKTPPSAGKPPTPGAGGGAGSLVDYEYWYPSGNQPNPPGAGWEKVPNGTGWRRPKGLGMLAGQLGGQMGGASSGGGAQPQLGSMKRQLGSVRPNTPADAADVAKFAKPKTPTTGGLASVKPSTGAVDPMAPTQQMSVTQPPSQPQGPPKAVPAKPTHDDTGTTTVLNAKAKLAGQPAKPPIDPSQFSHFTPEQHQEAYNAAFSSGDSDAAAHHLEQGMSKQKKKEHFDKLTDSHKDTDADSHEAFAQQHEAMGNKELADWHKQQAGAKRGSETKAPAAKEAPGKYSPEDSLASASYASHKSDASKLHASIKSHLESNPNLTPEQKEIAGHIGKIAEHHANQKSAPSPEGQKQMKQAMALAKKHGLHEAHKPQEPGGIEDIKADKEQKPQQSGMGFSGAFHAARARAMGMAGSAASGYAAGHIGTQIGQYATTEAARVGHKLLHGADAKGDGDGGAADRAMTDAERETNTHRVKNTKNSRMNIRR